MYYVYFIKSKNYNETYIGSTNDLRRRLAEHNNGMEISTKRYKPWRLIYYEAYRSEKDAREWEMKLKSHGNAIKELRKRIKQSLKNGTSKGFTLIEIVLAIFIMSLGIIAIMQVFPTTLMVSKDTEEMTRATFLAERKMEEVKGKIRYENDFANDYNESSPTAFPPPDENYKYTVIDTEDEHPGEVKEIKVTVWHDSNNNNSWDEGENRIILDTKVAKRT